MSVEFVYLHVVARGTERSHPSHEVGMVFVGRYRGTGFALISHVNSTPVLIVEDDAASRELMMMMLRLTGVGTVAATNGAEALKYLQGGGDACVILLDLMMPVMDGFEFRREQLREPRLAAIPVVVLSTMATARATELHGCALFDKPVNVFEVADLVRQLRSLGPQPS